MKTLTGFEKQQQSCCAELRYSTDRRATFQSTLTDRKHPVALRTTTKEPR